MSAKTRELPDFEFERDLVSRGFSLVAGVDEAGRGPLAGPVVAAAVILPVEWIQQGLPQSLRAVNDSKQLTAKAREALFEGLVSRREIVFGIAQAEVAMIDEINILQASCHAMILALRQLQPSPEHVLVDGRRVKNLGFPQTAIVQGDARSCCIAAASILAKVTRDRQMEALDREYPGYGFAEHKGYGTRAHLAAIEKLGACAIHRKSFAPLAAQQPELFEG